MQMYKQRRASAVRLRKRVNSLDNNVAGIDAQFHDRASPFLIVEESDHINRCDRGWLLVLTRGWSIRPASDDPKLRHYLVSRTQQRDSLCEVGMCTEECGCDKGWEDECEWNGLGEGRRVCETETGRSGHWRRIVDLQGSLVSKYRTDPSYLAHQAFFNLKLITQRWTLNYITPILLNGRSHTPSTEH